MKRLIFVLIWFSIKRRKLKACLSDILNNYLHFLLSHLFNDVYYKQVDRVTMGSPLGPTLANLFLVYYEYKWLEKYPLQFRPKYNRRYVDDIFLVSECRDLIKKFFKYMNSRHPNIQFTCEEESNKKMYRKKTFSGVYLNFNSFLPMDYKKRFKSYSFIP